MIEGHGDDAYRFGRILSNFSSNVYQAVDHSGLKAFLTEKLDTIRSYPEPEPYTLENLLARKYGVPAENVMVTSGATEAIYLIAAAAEGRHSFILSPTFSEYGDAAQIAGHRTDPVFSLEDLERAMLSPGGKVVWICNPNNPTGHTWDLKALRDLVSGHPDVLFVIDQSYGMFTRKEVFPVAEACRFRNLYLLHSMTKCYAVPGIRVGAVTAAPDRIQALRKRRMPWSVNALAVAAGIYLTEHSADYVPDLDFLLTERKRVADALEATGGVETLPSDTHYLSAFLKNGTAAQLKTFLAERHGLLIRDASNFTGFGPSYFRIAVQTRKENDLLIGGIREWISL